MDGGQDGGQNKGSLQLSSIAPAANPRHVARLAASGTRHRKPTTKLLALTDLDSKTWVSEVKRIRGRKEPLSSAGLHALRDEYTRTIEPTRALAAEILKLERTLSDLVNQAYGLTPAEIDLIWQTAPPRMPIPSPGRFLTAAAEAPIQAMARPDSARLARGPAALSGLRKSDADHRRD